MAEKEKVLTMEVIVKVVTEAARATVRTLGCLVKVVMQETRERVKEATRATVKAVECLVKVVVKETRKAMMKVKCLVVVVMEKE